MSPMPGPLLASMVVNSETAPLTPSIFQMAPGLPPLLSANCPSMKMAPALPRRCRSGRPSPSSSGVTMLRPCSEVAPA